MNNQKSWAAREQAADRVTQANRKLVRRQPVR